MGIGWKAVAGGGAALAAALVLHPTIAGSSTPARPASSRVTTVTAPAQVYASVSADGRPEEPSDGWSVEHEAPGRYLLHTPGGGIDLVSWEAPVAVQVLPAGGGHVEVRFVGRAGDVDSRFTFVLRP